MHHYMDMQLAFVKYSDLRSSFGSRKIFAKKKKRGGDGHDGLTSGYMIGQAEE